MLSLTCAFDTSKLASTPPWTRSQSPACLTGKTSSKDCTRTSRTVAIDAQAWCAETLGSLAFECILVFTANRLAQSKSLYLSFQSRKPSVSKGCDGSCVHMRGRLSLDLVGLQ